MCSSQKLLIRRGQRTRCRAGGWPGGPLRPQDASRKAGTASCGICAGAVWPMPVATRSTLATPARIGVISHVSDLHVIDPDIVIAVDDCMLPRA